MSAGLNPSRLVLASGVTVVSKQTRKTPAVSINLSVRAGSLADPDDAPGAVHLLSKVIDRGTATRPTSDIADALDNRGISLNVSVTRQVVSLTCTSLSEDFESVLALLGDIVMHPSLPDAELTTRKAQVLTTLRQDADNPAVRATETFMSLLYGDHHPYGRRIKGSADAIGALDRERLLALHAAYFGPTQTTAVIVGDIEPARAEDCAAAVFGTWRPAARSVTQPDPPALATGRRRVVVPMMNKSQADIVYGFAAIARQDPSYYAFLLMNNVLGQYAMGGRLGHSIRERQGMAYYASSSFDAAPIAGPFMVRAGVAASNVERAIASIDEELNLLRRTGVTGRELAESRQYLTGSMPRALETNAGIAAFLQNAEFFNLGLEYDRRLPNLLMAATIDEVNAAATALDPAYATIVVAGPYQPA